MFISQFKEIRLTVLIQINTCFH